jgi:hypothetical protein
MAPPRHRQHSLFSWSNSRDYPPIVWRTSLAVVCVLGVLTPYIVSYVKYHLTGRWVPHTWGSDHTPYQLRTGEL